MTIKLHSTIKCSTSNGPGQRFVIWTQGCSFNCAGCFNQRTHEEDDGYLQSINSLAQEINNTKNIRGITITGGEPLIQPRAINKLLSLINKDLDILIFSGFALNELKDKPELLDIIKKTDAALLGRYDNTKEHPFQNKKLIISKKRIQPKEIKPYFKQEVFINQKNQLTKTGLL